MSVADLHDRIPHIGFGTWNRDGQETYDGVQCALEVGYRHIDTAEGYNNEEFVGDAIAGSKVPRSEMFLTTKVAPEPITRRDTVLFRHYKRPTNCFKK